jgi:hypothetical protein
MLQRVERIAVLLEQRSDLYRGSQARSREGFEKRSIPSRTLAWLRGSGLLTAALGRDERGIELVEFVGFVPIVLLAVAIGWQFFLVGYTGVVASSAAREGARAAATREDVGRAVTWGSPDFDGRRSWNVSGVCPDYAGTPIAVQVELEVPHVTLPFLGALNAYPKVTAVATMRCEPPFQSP